MAITSEPKHLEPDEDPIPELRATVGRSAPNRLWNGLAPTGGHTGHRRLLTRTHMPGLVPTAVTFDPHPREVLGRPGHLMCSLAQRLEMAEVGIQDALVLPVTNKTSILVPNV